MPNNIIKQGDKYHVRVAIPADVQAVFGKRAFTQSLKATDKAEAL